MSAPMSLRRAVEIVAAGKPREVVWQDMGARIVDPPDPRRVAEWNRARSILAAAVEAHEALCANFDAPHGKGIKTWIEAQNAIDKLRKLERGE